ncbi:MAG: type I pullulanase, partial [Saprospiraceae bacterium]|nr:type I pullulanase [Saprospiraceae bacterium]
MRILFLLFILSLFSCMPDPQPSTYESYDDYPVYNGSDLGLTYTPSASTFKVWAPAATDMRLLLFDNDLKGEASETIDMKYTQDHLWQTTIKRDLAGTYYCFSSQNDGTWNEAVPDPYARAVGTNGKRAQVVDLDATDPSGWENDQSPTLKHPTDIVIYELHIRDLSMHPASDITNKGKFLGLTETGTRT